MRRNATTNVATRILMAGRVESGAFPRAFEPAAAGEIVADGLQSATGAARAS